VSDVSFTADSSKLIATAARTFVFWGIASRQITATLSYDPPCRFLATSPDGSSIATTAKNGDVLLWDSLGGKPAARPTRNDLKRG
jgi:hypothetical protein